jgi:hypothetical protein
LTVWSKKGSYLNAAFEATARSGQALEVGHEMNWLKPWHNAVLLIERIVFLTIDRETVLLWGMQFV